MAGSLRRRLTVAIALLHAFLILLFVSDQVRREYLALTGQTRQALLSEAGLLARSGRDWVVSRDLAGLQDLLHTVKGVQGIEYAMYLDRSGRVLAHTDEGKVGLVLDDALSREVLKGPVGEPRLIQQTDELSDALAPVRYGDRVVGWARVARNHDAEHDALRLVLVQALSYVLVAAVTGGLAALLIARGLTSDLRRASRLFAGVRGGDLTQRLEHARRDELGALLSGINETLDALVAKEQMLRLTQERLELAVKGANDGIWDWDLVTNHVFYSARWKSMLGYKEDELGDQPAVFLDRVLEDDLPLLLDLINNYLEGRAPAFEIIVRMRHRDGGLRWILTRGSAVRDATGRAIRMSGTHTDVTALKDAEAGRALERSRLYSLLEQMYTGVLMEDAEGRVAVANQAFCELFPMADTPGELLGKSRAEVWQACRSLVADGEAMLQRLEQVVARGEAVIGEAVELRDGRVIERDFLPMRAGHRLLGVVWTFRDMSSRVRLENTLAAQRERLRVTLLSIGDAVISTDDKGCIDFLNPVAEQLTGWSNEAAAGRPLGEVLQLVDAATRKPRPDPAVEALRQHVLTPLDGETLLVSRSGRECIVEDSAAPIRDSRGDVCGAVVVFRDATERYRMQERLRWQATHDPLTGLANRLLLEDRLMQAMARARRQERLLAVCVLDLDAFKPVNDRLGHDAGDELLQAVAHRLATAVRIDDTVARLGGDEFVLLLGSLQDVSEMDACLERMLVALAEPVTIAGEVVRTQASIGVTLYPLNDSNADALLRHADQAMYAAKQAGGHCYRLFDFADSQASVEKQRRRERIGEAIRRGEMVLYYQPRVDMREGRMVGAEALVRWQHPEEGLLLPDAFLPLIDNDHEIHRLGEWVIRTALAQLAAWHEQGESFGVSVNLSAPHLLSPGFIPRLAELLAEQPQLPREVLEIEVVESVALDDIERAATVVSDIRRLGVRVAIDDFGVGYASLGYLRRLPVDVVKIDKSFVLDMLDDEDDFEVVQAVTALARALHREPVAEGVESDEHGLLLLLRLGCTQIQGYGISAPLPAGRLLSWYRDWRPDPRWADWRDVPWNMEERPLFTAARDLGRWVDAVTATAHGYVMNLNDAELRDPEHCRFGRWFHVDGERRYGEFSAFHALDSAHRELHLVGSRIVDLCGQQLHAQARALLPDLERVRQRVIRAIDALMRASSEDARRRH
ncbi:EAL domain-containing protein [Methyloversatilis thermotolerans]|uniref:EAL domain-containing protein n=1 Tax=Methyloversatilis thermotolerans TaxID=1346290 RepID=UPI0003633CE9|nr:EAL domain-containing protein [Methyloversatilis thermotolerans]